MNLAGQQRRYQNEHPRKAHDVIIRSRPSFDHPRNGGAGRPRFCWDHGWGLPRGWTRSNAARWSFSRFV